MVPADAGEAKATHPPLRHKLRNIASSTSPRPTTEPSSSNVQSRLKICSIEEQIRAEIPGIFNLVLAAPEGEILEHPKSHILQSEFEELSSPYMAFINEWCTIDPDEFIPTEVLWAYYCQWCKLNNHQPPSPQKFKIDFNGVHDNVSRYRPQFTSQQVDALKLEYNLDARPGRGLDVSNRPHCYRGINVKNEVKNTWNVQEI